MSGSRILKLWLITLATCLGDALNMYAQDSTWTHQPWAGFGIDAHLLGGQVFKHEKKFTLPIPSLTTGVDVNFTLRTYGQKAWEQRRHYPRIGLATTAIFYGIDSVYGHTIGIYPNITLPIISRQRFEWTLRIGDGIGYVTKRYSRVPPLNTVNVAIGSHVNDLIMIMTDAGWNLNDRWEMQVGAFVTHISNGSVRKPNLGVNVAGLSAGVRYFPVSARPQRIHRELPHLRNRYLLQARTGMSLVSAFTPRGPLYPVRTATLYVSRRWRDHNKAFAGIDYSWHGNIRAYLLDNNILPARQASREAYKSAVVLGDELMLGRAGILLQLGIYLHKGYLQKEDAYQKVCLNYYLVQHENGPVKEFFIFAGLKAHLNVAEMGELGIGMGL